MGGQTSHLHKPIANATRTDARLAPVATHHLVQLATTLNMAPQAMRLAAIGKTLASATAVPLVQRRANKTGLPDHLKNGIERLSGMAMDHVRVHYNSSRPAQLHAHAYAQGSDIHVAPGSQRHLPHEAWHVVQQAQGRVRPTMRTPQGIAINDDRGLEREADHMGARATRGA